jgi:hypothetical protein
MSARKVSREPYRIGRSRREIWTAVAAALAIVLMTVVVVWILAPPDPPRTGVPVVDAPSASTPTQPSGTFPPATTGTTAAAEATTGTTGG